MAETPDPSPKAAARQTRCSQCGQFTPSLLVSQCWACADNDLRLTIQAAEKSRLRVEERKDP